jgi:alcohol dehydrogenase class IV
LNEDSVIAPFEYSGPLQRVILEPDALRKLASETQALGATRALVICGGKTRRTELFKTVTAELGELCAGVFDEVVEHSATTLVTQGAERARALGIDALVAVGGGSASDTAKGIAILLAEGGRIEEHASRFVPPDQFFPKPLPSPKLPVIAIPTTASAAEVTPGLGIRDPATGAKLLFWDVKLACRLIILDPKANLEVPAALMASTGMNGFAHCAEGLYSRLRNPISEGLALQGARLLARGLPAMVREPAQMEHRATVLIGAYLSGMVISNARVGIHHAVCHCLGALGGLPHGVANSIMLPHALAYNLDVAAAELRGLAEAMGVAVAGKSNADAARAAVDAVTELQIAAKVPRRLRDTGLDHALLPRIAEHTLRDRGLFFNPKRTASAEPILALLEQAW